ncbi:MAG: helix-turn-helix transcriptional regulator [Erysipelotrichaceae bacterium]|nr:helix-turn-helix transcriptional regulator [Erysipelotrichaceae bacterium]
MDTSKAVKAACKLQGVSLSELAARLGQSRQNLYNKLRRNKMSGQELQQIAEALGISFQQTFILSNETIIQIDNSKEVDS